ncbi:MAG: hypothetical protein GY821_07690 [Gammaproteobacteria bacterium]|nr:hypothetical protein [Gammaproteobacteria bacterium]
MSNINARSYPLAKAKDLGWLDKNYNPTATSPKMFQKKMIELKQNIAKSIAQLQSGNELGDFSINNHTTNYMKSDLRSGSLQYIELAHNQNWIALKDGQITLTQAGKNAGLTVNKINTNNIHNYLRTNQCKEYLYNIHAGLMSIAFNTLDGRDKSNNTIFSYCTNVIEKIMTDNAGIKRKISKTIFSKNENRYESYILSERIRAIHNVIKRKKIHIDPNSGKITFDKDMMNKEIYKLAKERVHMVERKTRMIYNGIKSGKIKIDQGTGEIDFDESLLEKSEYSEIYNEIKQGKIQINQETSAISFDEDWLGQETARMINEEIRPLEEKIKAIQLALKNNKIKIDGRSGAPIFDRALLKQKKFKEIYNEIKQGKISINPKSHEIKFDNDWLEQHRQPALSEEIYEELSETVSNEIVSVIQQSEEKLKFNDCPDKSVLDEYSNSQAMNDDDIKFNQSHLQSNSYSSGTSSLIINSPSFSGSENKYKTQNQSYVNKTNDNDYYDKEEIDYVAQLI